MREPILGFVLGDGGKPASPRDYIYLYVYPSTLYRVRYTYIYPTAFTYEGFPSKTQLHVFPKLEALPFIAPHGYLQQAAHPPALTLPKELHKTRSRFPKPACNTKNSPNIRTGCKGAAYKPLTELLCSSIPPLSTQKKKKSQAPRGAQAIWGTTSGPFPQPSNSRQPLGWVAQALHDPQHLFRVLSAG